MDLKPFLRAFLQAAPRCAQAPDLAQRLTLYQIEHEIQQIIWDPAHAESLRIPRLIHWMEGGVEALLQQL